MRMNKLGRTGLFVSELCLGTMTFGGSGDVWSKIGALNQSDAERLVGRAIEAGVNFIDTADVYSAGLSEQITGQALRNLKIPREQVVIATKAYGTTGPGANEGGASRLHLMDACKASLKRLQLDHIDPGFFRLGESSLRSSFRLASGFLWGETGMWLIWAIFPAALLVSCSATQQSEPQTYRVLACKPNLSLIGIDGIVNSIDQAINQKDCETEARIEDDADVIRAAQEDRRRQDEKADWDRRNAEIQREGEIRMEAQRAAESSPDNMCRKPLIAGEILDLFNTSRPFLVEGLIAVNLEHVTTLNFDESGTYSCHLTVVASNGQRMSGVVSSQMNIADRRVLLWRMD